MMMMAWILVSFWKIKTKQKNNPGTISTTMLNTHSLLTIEEFQISNLDSFLLFRFLESKDHQHYSSLFIVHRHHDDDDYGLAAWIFHSNHFHYYTIPLSWTLIQFIFWVLFSIKLSLKTTRKKSYPSTHYCELKMNSLV